MAVTGAAAALRAICITGPTGCGKTEAALALADELPLEIVSMDSALVYRGMDIGTAKPPPEVLRRYPHHLVDIREPEDTYSAGAFRIDAAAAAAAIRARGKWPLIVGGTLLYLRALREGLAELPPRDERIRRALDAEAAAEGWEALHARLRAVDPVSAARIEPRDRQRIQRALEVHALTGTPLADLTREPLRQSPKPEIETFALVPAERAELKHRLERRFDAMIAAGFVEEVRRLRARPGLQAAHASMRSVGYRQIWAHLAGAYEWPEARRRAVAATRQLAKRQLTWLRSDDRCRALEAFDAGLASALRHGIAAVLDRWA